MSDKARGYQDDSINQIRSFFQQGIFRVLLWLATGGGKTYIFCKMAKEAAARGKRVIIVVRGRKLVDQASKRLFREKVVHGVLMAKHWNYRPNAPIQVCSIDTLIARNLKPPADLIVIDEAHLFDKNSQASEFIAQYDPRKTFVVAVTATPYVRKGLKHLADAVVHPITMLGLMDLGFLVRFRYFAPDEPDMSQVRISSTTGDFVTAESEAAMIQGELTGNIVEHWKDICAGRPTIYFCVNVNHSKILAAKFRENGIAAEHVDADSTDEEREAVIKRSESGETKVVCNVGILCTGVDMPWIRAIGLARPTTSENLFIQICGRGTRPVYAPGFDLESVEGRLAAIEASEKRDCIVLDHAGNIKRLRMIPTDEIPVDLNGEQDDAYKKKSRTCPKCRAIFRGAIACPECGYQAPESDAPSGDFAESDGKLKEMTGIDHDPVRRALKELDKERKKKDPPRKPSWAYHRLIERFGFEASKPYLPDWFITRYEGGSSSGAFSKSPFARFTR